jgi:glycosyltransferase involved in cell wall biosynthesis
LRKLFFRRADVFYSRDVPTLLALGWFKPRASRVYEAHQKSHTALGRMLERWCLKSAALVVSVTGRLGDALRSSGARRVLVAHDGFRAKRFLDLPDPKAARQALHLPSERFLVGYVGRLHTMSMSKGVDLLIEAMAHAQAGDHPMSLCLVGGPDDMADALRAQWLQCGLPAEDFFSMGQVAPATVPIYLAALDVCTLPFPWTDHFALYASPLKLFEYMASGTAILASDLPAVAEVVRNEESALLVPPGDVASLAKALTRLAAQPELRARLGDAARRVASQYTWRVRAERILREIQESNARRQS